MGLVKFTSQSVGRSCNVNQIKHTHNLASLDKGVAKILFHMHTVLVLRSEIVILKTQSQHTPISVVDVFCFRTSLTLW